MSTEVLQEFLVKLGYKVDSVSANRFSKSLSTMNKGVLGVGAAVVGMVFLAQKSMRDFATEMEDLKYTSQLANSSANSINNASRALQQFGFKPGQIEGIITGFAGMIAASPGLEAMMKSMGVGLNPDKAIEFFNVMRKLEAMPEPVAIRTAAEFGVDITSYRLIRGHVGEMAAEWERVDRANKRAGNNLDEQVKQGREFSNTLRDIGNQIDAISTKLMGLSIEKFGMRWVKTMREELDMVMGALGGEKKETGALGKQATEAVTSAGGIAGAGANVMMLQTLKLMQDILQAKTPVVESAEKVKTSFLPTPSRVETRPSIPKAPSSVETLTLPIPKAPEGGLKEPLKKSLAATKTPLSASTVDNSVNVTNHNTFHIQGTDAKANAKEVVRQLNRPGFDEKAITSRNNLQGHS